MAQLYCDRTSRQRAQKSQFVLACVITNPENAFVSSGGRICLSFQSITSENSITFLFLLLLIFEHNGTQVSDVLVSLCAFTTSLLQKPRHGVFHRS